MGKEKYEIDFYEKIGGRRPAEDFLNSLSAKERVFTAKALERLERIGRDDLSTEHVRYLRNKIWELRVKIPRTQCRLLFFFHDGHKYIMTNGFKKKTDKVPDSEIDKAIEHRSDYLVRQARE